MEIIYLHPLLPNGWQQNLIMIMIMIMNTAYNKKYSGMPMNKNTFITIMNRALNKNKVHHAQNLPDRRSESSVPLSAGARLWTNKTQ